MEFIHIASADDFRAKEIYNSYMASFPEDERRDENQFRCLFEKERVKVFSILNDLQFVGYLITWKLTDAIFIEHFEIFPDFRSKNFGSKVIKKLFRDCSKIMLESEPETLNENARRRIEFYKRNGFIIIDENYLQPPYDKEKKPLNLWLMSNYQPEKPDGIRDEIYDVVYRQETKARK